MNELRTRVDEKAAETGVAGVVRFEQAGDVTLDAAYGLADRARVVGIVHRLGGERAQVEDVVPFGLEGGDQGLFERKAGVVATDRDSHGPATPILSGVRKADNLVVEG